MFCFRAVNVIFACQRKWLGEKDFRDSVDEDGIYVYINSSALDELFKSDEIRMMSVLYSIWILHTEESSGSSISLPRSGRHPILRVLPGSMGVQVTGIFEFLSPSMCRFAAV